MKYNPVKLHQHFQQKRILKKKLAVMQHIGVTRRTHYLNLVANSDVTKLDQDFGAIDSESSTAAAAPCYDTGLD